MERVGTREETFARDLDSPLDRRFRDLRPRPREEFERCPRT